MSDFNLPPGVTVGMLPGNGPEEGDWEEMMGKVEEMLVSSDLKGEDILLAVKIGIEALNTPNKKAKAKIKAINKLIRIIRNK